MRWYGRPASLPLSLSHGTVHVQARLLNVAPVAAAAAEAGRPKKRVNRGSRSALQKAVSTVLRRLRQVRA